MSVDIGTEAVQFLFWDYMNVIFVAMCMDFVNHTEEGMVLVRFSSFIHPLQWTVTEL